MEKEVKKVRFEQRKKGAVQKGLFSLLDSSPWEN
jgi:hypothetical protein